MQNSRSFRGERAAVLQGNVLFILNRPPPPVGERQSRAVGGRSTKGNYAVWLLR